MFLMHEEHDGRFGPIVEQRITVVSDDTINLADGDDMTWIPNSGATIHATSRRDLFTNYTVDDFGVVKMENNDRAQIIGRAAQRRKPMAQRIWMLDPLTYPHTVGPFPSTWRCVGSPRSSTHINH
jgi:hypothetical protein